jgi:hypothetical protein
MHLAILFAPPGANLKGGRVGGMTRRTENVARGVGQMSHAPEQLPYLQRFLLT